MTVGFIAEQRFVYLGRSGWRLIQQTIGASQALGPTDEGRLQAFLVLRDGGVALSVDQAYRYLRRAHIWGEAPYHYADARYVQLVDRIRELRLDA
jgi:hypothetical protein